MPAFIGAAQILGVCLLLTLAKSHVTTFKSPNQLHPVHGLYVKPSGDGTTGDLYVAATEDNGSKTQWLTDQPVNFLPVAPSSTHQITSVPISFAPASSSHEESQATQKRAVLASQPVQYAYALPFTSATEGRAYSYPYAIPTIAPTAQNKGAAAEATPAHQCSEASPATFPYSPFQYFYPHMMSAYANAKTVLKESGMSDENAGSIVSQTSPIWSPYGAYPMYVMVDPTAWVQAQSAQTSSSATTTESST